MKNKLKEPISYNTDMEYHEIINLESDIKKHISNSKKIHFLEKIHYFLTNYPSIASFEFKITVPIGNDNNKKDKFTKEIRYGIYPITKNKESIVVDFMANKSINNNFQITNGQGTPYSNQFIDEIDAITLSTNVGFHDLGIMVAKIQNNMTYFKTMFGVDINDEKTKLFFQNNKITVNKSHNINLRNLEKFARNLLSDEAFISFETSLLENKLKEKANIIHTGSQKI